MVGDIGILNVGAGDTKIVFDNSNPAETIRAARVVKDMLRRGYALLVEVGNGKDGRPKYRRVKDFDEKTSEYIIADFDPIVAADHDAKESEYDEATKTPPRKTTKKARSKKTKRIKASKTKGTAVARISGG